MKKVTLSKKIVDRQLYLYANGELIYKKWFDTNAGRMFHDNEGLTQEVIDNEKRKQQ